DEAKSETAQRNNLFNHALVTPQARLLPVGAPDAAKGAMLRASAGSLHGGPHVLVGPHQFPAGGQEIVAGDAAAFVQPAGCAGKAIGDDRRPDDIPIAPDDGVGVPAFERFLGVKGGVNAAVDYPGAPFARHAADLVAAQCIAGVDADADYVASA